MADEISEEITGPYPELARKVRELMRGMSTRVAQRKTGVSHSTIASMVSGDKVGASAITRFAIGFNTDPNDLLQAAGIVPPKAGQVGYYRLEDNTLVERNLILRDEVERIPDPDFVPDPDEITIHAEGFSGLDEVAKAQATMILKNTAQAFVESMKMTRAATATGGGMSPEEKRQWQAKKDESRDRLRKRIADESDESDG